MTDTDTDLSAAFEEATDAAERAGAERAEESLPEDERESLREATERLASDASSASVAELLDAAGFDDVPDDVSPVDLPAVIRDADAAAIVELRRLLRLADLGESWTALSDEERIDRLERVVGDEEEDDGGFAQLKEYLDQFGHLGGEGDADDADDAATESTGDAAEEDGAEEGDAESDDADEGIIDSLTSDDEGGDDEGFVESLTDDGDESADDSDEELVELEDHVARLKELVGGDHESDADGEDDAAEEGDDDADDESEADDGPMSTDRSSGPFSTVPASRSDTAPTGRFSTVRGRK